MTDKNRISTSIPSFQPNNPPVWERSKGFAVSRGRAPKSVPEGHKYLQKAGILAKPPNKNTEPMNTRKNKTAYFPNFKIW